MIQQVFPPTRKEELDSASASMPGPSLESGYVGLWGKAGHQLHSLVVEKDWRIWEESL
jgi:hypothetical protein